MSRLQESADAIRRRRGTFAPEGQAAPGHYGGITEEEIASVGEDAPPEEMIRDPELEEAAAQLRPGSIPAQVGQAVMGAQPMRPPAQAPATVDNRDEDELHAAQEADRKSHLTAGLELAGRQMVGGITRTPVGQGMGAAPSQVPGAISAAKSRREQAAEVLRLKRQGEQDGRQARLDDSTLDLQASAAEKNRRSPEPKGGIDYSEIKEKEFGLRTEQLAETIRANKERERLKTEEQARKGRPQAPKALEDIPPGFEVDAGANPGKETRRDFSKLVTTAERMKGLTAQMREALKGTSGASRVLDPSVRTRLQQLSTQIQIEAKDVAGLGALSGPDMGLMQQMASDPTSIMANLTVDMPTMLGQLDKWAENSVSAKSNGTGIRRKGGAKAAATGAETKTVGGKTYKRVAGGWDEVK